VGAGFLGVLEGSDVSKMPALEKPLRFMTSWLPGVPRAGVWIEQTSKEGKLYYWNKKLNVRRHLQPTPWRARAAVVPCDAPPTPLALRGSLPPRSHHGWVQGPVAVPAQSSLSIITAP
jgi:hypothetical protein